ncbi:MAG: hypothetical protein R2795_23025 [Saprospiraceae bacterium]
MADKDLNQLITALKTEAIEAAENEAAKILAKAHEQAQALEAAAQQRKQQLLKDAEAAAESRLQAGETALRQAARDLKVGLQQELFDLLQTVLEKEVRKSLTPDLIRAVIVPILENVGKDAEIQLPDEQLTDLLAHLRHQLKEEASSIKVKAGKLEEAHFQIRKTEEGWRYDITPEAITEALRPLLAKKWEQIL